MDKKLKDAIHGLANDPIAFDTFLFPDSYPLKAHSRIIIKECWKKQQIWVEAARGMIKTHTAARYVLGRMLLNPGWKEVCSAPSYRQAKLPWREARELVYQSPFYPDLVSAITESTEGAKIRIANSPSSSFEALPASFGKVHGARGHGIIFEEFWEYPEELFTRAVAPMAAIRRGGRKNQFIYLTTAGYEFQFSYRIRQILHKDAEAGKPNVAFLSFDLDDARDLGLPMEWDLIEQQRLIDPDTYQQQFYNRWMMDSGQFHKLAVMMSEDIKHADIILSQVPGHKYVGGLDTARSVRAEGDDSCLVVWDIGPPPKIVFIKVWNGVRYETLSDDIVDIAKRFNLQRLKMDFGGGGGTLYEDHLRMKGLAEIDDPLATGKRIISKFLNSPEHIYNTHRALAGSFEEKMILTPSRPEDDSLEKLESYQETLSAFKQLADLKTRQTATGWTRFEAPSGKKRDKGYALLYGYDAIRDLLLPLVDNSQTYEGPGVIGSDIGSLMYPSWMNRIYG